MKKIGIVVLAIGFLVVIGAVINIVMWGKALTSPDVYDAALQGCGRMLLPAAEK